MIICIFKYKVWSEVVIIYVDIFIEIFIYYIVLFFIYKILEN